MRRRKKKRRLNHWYELNKNFTVKCFYILHIGVLDYICIYLISIFIFRNHCRQAWTQKAKYLPRPHFMAMNYDAQSNNLNPYFLGSLMFTRENTLITVSFNLRLFKALRMLWCNYTHHIFNSISRNLFI